MRKLVIILLLFLTCLATYGLYQYFANKAFDKPQIVASNLVVPIIRLEKDLFQLTSEEEIRDFLHKHPLFSQRFLHISNAVEEEHMVSRLYALVHDPAMQELCQEVVQTFKDFTQTQQQIEKGFRYFQTYYPDVAIPQIVTFITGMDTELYVDQDLIVIGLDFFLGENARFRPLNTPQYILRTYQPAYIAPKIFLLLSQYFQTKTDKDPTLLHDMLICGKEYYFTQALLPDVSPHIILGYTPEQLAAVQQHQPIIWTHFIENQLLYETNHLLKKRYLGNRPFTAEIGRSCPGNIGGWLGWEIIKQYMQRCPNTSLPELMAQTDAQYLFTTSRYRPKKIVANVQ
jgi:gliding motility-associated lipoprotein GldB